MTTERPEDFEQVRDYVVEQTRKASMEQIGVDLTKQDTDDFQQGFTIEKRRVGQDVRLCISGLISNLSVLLLPACLLVEHAKIGG